MRKFVFRAIAIAVVVVPAVTFAQGAKTKPTTATWISKEEVDTVNKNGQGIDRNIKVVDIGHENFTVGIIHRGKTVNGVADRATPAAISSGIQVFLFMRYLSLDFRIVGTVGTFAE